MTLLILSLVAMGCGKNSEPGIDTAPPVDQAPDSSSEATTAGAVDDAETHNPPATGDSGQAPGADTGAAGPQTDVDGDGVPAGEDCDDADAERFPGADEHCDGRDDDCDGVVDDEAVDAPTWYLDADGDGLGDPARAVAVCEAPSGYVSEPTDCDDADPTRYPGAEERCDGLDDDCDGAIDEEATDAETWSIDADGDGFGAAGIYDARACQLPAGYASADPSLQDCDDADAQVHPGADEVCDGVDNDCDGDTDPDDALDAGTWYMDADGDGYGGADSAVACAAPAGATATSEDCDDADAESFPGAEERCDERDNDCDGDIDEDAVDAPTWYGDSDGDGYGLVSVQLEDCQQPGGYAAEKGDCDDAAPERSPGEAELCGDGVDNDCDDETSCRLSGALSVSDSDAVLTGAAGGDGFGAAVAPLGDAGLLVYASDRSSQGVSYLFEDDLEIGRSASDADAILTGASAGDSAGAALAAGDVDADGYVDLLVGAPTADVREPGTPEVGAGYLLLGPIGGDVDLSDAQSSWLGSDDGDGAGSAVAGGDDYDGDGDDDLLIGAPGAGGRGRVYLVSSYASGEFSLDSDADAVINSEDRSDGFGQALAGVGDVDGDGVGDFLIGATGVDVGTGASEKTDAGAAYLISGGFYGDWDVSLLWQVRFLGGSSGALAGSAVASAGDVNGDGDTDFLVGAPNHLERGNRTGQAALVLGGLAAGTELELADAEGLLTGDDGDEVGAAVAGVGDVDGDGYDDVAVGAPGVDYGGGTDNGAIYLFYGGRTINWSSPDLTVYGDDGDMLGAALAGPLDIDGDGYYDLVAGAPGDDSAGAEAGAVRIFLGTGQ